MKTYYTIQCDDENRPNGIEVDKFFELREGNLVYEYAKKCQEHNLEYEIYIIYFDENTNTIEKMINVNNEFKNIEITIKQ